jgi:hypothetical protein
MTNGFTVLCFMIIGKAIPAAAPVTMKSRRFIFVMVSSFGQEVEPQINADHTDQKRFFYQCRSV